MKTVHCLSIKDDDVEAAGSELKAVVGDVMSLAKAAEETKDMPKISHNHPPRPLADPPKALAETFKNLPSLEEIPDSMIGKLFQNNMAFDEITDFASTFAELLDRLDLSILHGTDETLLKLNDGPSETFLFDTNPSEGFSFCSDLSGGHGGIFNDRPFLFQGIDHHQRGFSLPDMSNFLSDYEYGIVMEKHQLRKEAIGDICLPKCNVTEEECNCKKLFGCVQNMTEVSMRYDHFHPMCLLAYLHSFHSLIWQY